MVKTLKITKDDLSFDNFYKGKIDASYFDGDIEIDGGLGMLKFWGGLVASGKIVVGKYTGIYACYTIRSGRDITLSCGDIEVNGNIVVGGNLKVHGLVKASEYIKVGGISRIT